MIGLIKKNMEKICFLIDEIPDKYNDVMIMSDIRKKYYCKTITIRLDLMEKCILS